MTPATAPSRRTAVGVPAARTRCARRLRVVPYVYAFDHKHRRPPMEYKDLLGGKGANLAEMTSVLKLPVPPGFTISTDACRAYMAGGWPTGLDDEIAKQVAKLEKQDGPPARRPRRPAARQRALRRQVLDAGDDGHRPQPRAQRQEREGPRRGDRRRALRLRLLPPVHLDVRPHRARRRRRAVRAPARGGQGRRPASPTTPTCRPAPLKDAVHRRTRRSSRRRPASRSRRTR